MNLRAYLSISNLSISIFAIVLAIFPFFTDSRSLLILMTQIFILAVFAMSYDIMLGYSGIISFGHAMFFGIGAYTTGSIMRDLDNTVSMFLFSILITVLLTALLSYVVGILSLRLKSHFFAMLTLAVSGLLVVLVEKWRSFTRGNDGFTFLIPETFRDREIYYFITLAFLVLMFLVMKRFIESPAGRVIQGMRENEERVKSLGYNILHYKVLVSVFSGVIAGMTGCMYIITLRFVNPSMLDVMFTLDALLMTIIGGVGTLWGGIIGAFLYKFAQYFLADLSSVHWIFERWIILFGTIFILFVMFFPSGIMGSIKKVASKFDQKKHTSNSVDKRRNIQNDQRF